MTKLFSSSSPPEDFAFALERHEDLVGLIVVMQGTLARFAADDGNIEAVILSHWNILIRVFADAFTDDLINFPFLTGNHGVEHGSVVAFKLVKAHDSGTPRFFCADHRITHAASSYIKGLVGVHSLFGDRFKHHQVALVIQTDAMLERYIDGFLRPLDPTRIGAAHDR